jgi:hypothetical protein
MGPNHEELVIMDQNAEEVGIGGDDQPERFGRFRVIAPLAKGGMGLVYLVEDENGREAVVKTIRSDLAADPGYRARFRNEAQAAVRFRSSLVARVWECDAGADTPWIALEKIEGPTLREVVLDGKPYGRAELAALAADLAEGVHAFYDQGMAHGDLTPSNIIIQDGARVKILDLGLARPTADETATGDLPAMGTPYWLAPEVAAGFAPDNLSDVNQWGKLVLFAGTGYPRSGPGGIREALSELPSPLRPIVERCLSPVPDSRPDPEELWNRTRERRLAGNGPPAIALASTRLGLQQGQRVATTAVVTSTSARDEVYLVELLGPLAGSGTVNPPRLKLAAGDEGHVEVSFALPDDSQVLPRDWPFAVRCAAEADLSRSAVVEGMVSVPPRSHIQIEVLGQLPRGRWTGRYALAVSNRGNVGTGVRLSASDQSDGLSFAVSPAAMAVTSGETAIGRVKVRTRRPFLSGEEVRHHFRVSALPLDDAESPGPVAPAFLDLVFAQAPVLSRRSMWAVLIVGLVVVIPLGLAILLGYLNAGS